MKKGLIIFLSCIILCGIIWILKNPFCYDSDYWKDIGLQGAHIYSNIVSQKGEPQEIKHIDNESIVTYDDVRFVWYNQDFNGVFVRVEIVDNTVLIGKKDLCIGSDENDVKKAYNSVFIKSIKDLPKNCVGYIDNGVCVIYYFDEYNKVNKITISHDI